MEEWGARTNYPSRQKESTNIRAGVGVNLVCMAKRVERHTGGKLEKKTTIRIKSK